MASPGTDEPPQRRRLVLKPRDETAAQRASLERAASGKSNPFGAAKPRESVLANRSGKKEEEILKEEVLKEKLQLRLSPDQLDAKTALESAVEEVKQELVAESDDQKKDALKVELKEREAKLDTMLAEFEKLAVERARSGEIGMRPSERRRQVEEAQLAAGGGYAPKPDGYGAPGRGGGFDGGGRGFAGRTGFDYDGHPAEAAALAGAGRGFAGRTGCDHSNGSANFAGAPGRGGGFGGGGRGFAGRTGYDYGNGGGRGGGRGSGGGFGAGYQPTGNYQGGGQGGGYRDSYKDAGGYDAAGTGGYAGSPPGGYDSGFGGRGGGPGRGGRGNHAGAGGLYDRFGGGNGYEAAPYGGGDVEYQSPYAHQDRF